MGDEIKGGSGNVFNILKYSIHDGPGIRNTVFLKGCPLSCWWCHNPESQKLESQLMIYPNRCIGCGECVKIAGKDMVRHRDGDIFIDDILDKSEVEKLAEECFAEAISMDSEEMTVEEVIEEVLKDNVFYEQSSGGVTISGGEPFVQVDFLLELLKALKEKGVHTTVDTSGYTSEENLLKAAKYTDLFLYDIKMINPEKHIEYTGVDNKLILNNLKALLKNGSDVYIRIPIIPGVNLNDIEINNIMNFINDLDNKENIKRINILPYHRIGEEKYNRLKEDYKMGGVKEPSKEEMERVREIMEKTNIEVKIGG